MCLEGALLAQRSPRVRFPVCRPPRPGRLQGRSALAFRPLTTSFGFELGITDAPQRLLYNRRSIEAEISFSITLGRLLTVVTWRLASRPLRAMHGYWKTSEAAAEVPYNSH